MNTPILTYNSPQLEIITMEVEQPVLNTSGQNMETGDGNWV